MGQPISEAFERCQRRFPTVRISLEVFEARIHQILSSELQSAAAFEKIHHEDLYLAIACSHDERVAWEYFADDYVPVLRRFALQACGNPGDAEDLTQEITTKLMKEKARLAGYNGRGSLAGWLRVAVSHAAIDRFRRAKRITSLEELEETGAAVALESPAKDQDGESLDSRWGPVVTGMAEETLRALPARDRLLLSLYYLQGVSLKEIGRQFAIHEATASRWLERMRRDIRKQIERGLRKKHRLSSGEISSLWRWVSPSSLAEAIGGASTETLALRESGALKKKAAIGENSGVIEKEELQ